MVNAKRAGTNPRALAASLVDVLKVNPPAHTTSIEIAGAGFINFHLDDGWLHDALADLLTQGEDGYARPDVGHGERVQVEFISANPTGPIHVGNGWWGSYGDALARVLTRAGHQVSREYYVNDTGGQIRTLGESLLAHGRAVTCRGGYSGEYVTELAGSYDGADDVTIAGRWAADKILEHIRATCPRWALSSTSGTAKRRSRRAARWTRPSPCWPSGVWSSSRTAPPGSAPLTWGQPGPGLAQVQRGCHVPGRRPGVPPGQIPGARLRSSDRRLRR